MGKIIITAVLMLLSAGLYAQNEPDFVFDDMNKFFDYLPHLSINNKKEEQS